MFSCSSMDNVPDGNYPAEYLEDEDPIGITSFPELDENCLELEAELGHDEFCGDSSAVKRQSSQCTFDFRISCFKKEFRGQHHDKGKADAKLITKECRVFGNSPREILEQTWEAVKTHIRREVIVYDDESFKRVKWANDAALEFEDMNKYVLFKDLLRKRTYRTSDLQEKSDIMVKWRGKVIDVYLHVYSLSVANQKLYDLVKRLEAPEDPDRSGACSNKSFQGLIKELKELHPDIIADSFVWHNWAEYVEAAPGYRRDEVKQNPPDAIQPHLRAAPTDASVVLEENRRGLLFAKTIIRAMEGQLTTLREYSGQLSTAAIKMEERLSGMEIQLKSYNEMLTSMQRSIAPVENELSRTLADSVTDADDLDHM
ncbi:uncharacterized protein LOC134226695 [Armigeres subalbatus]|uniref:uncharacterized protein LOC134226695 n=1 Tax=Armigeres subalbatus TaxID=124917 RepID=UPI002ED5D4CF